MRNKILSYIYAFPLGVYFYLIFQVVYLKRFGSFNWSIAWTDLGLLIVGVLSVLLFQYYARRLASKWWLMLAPFILALPISFMAALGGGLLGIIGIVIFGLVPFLIILPLGFWVIKKSIASATYRTSV